MTSPSHAQLHQQVAGTFIGPIAPLPDQPEPVVTPMNWDAFDVPRLWDMVRDEGDPLAQAQVHGFQYLAELLADEHDTLKTLRELLVSSWDPQSGPAAAKFLAILDALIASMADDAVAHSSTSRGLDGVLETLNAAREKIAPMKSRWDMITTDWTPEWWDQAADELNRQARQVLADTDEAVGQHGRRMLAAPHNDPILGAHGHERPVVGAVARLGFGHGAAEAPLRTVPPIPGCDPLAVRGPDLAGLPNVAQPVPAVPGSPVSMLPIPPGNQHAPGGGLYALPGPGIGNVGRIYHVPTTYGGRGAGVAGAMRGGVSGVAGAPTAGMIPAMAPPAAGADGRGNRAGSRDLSWEVAQGVPPVIGAVPDEIQPPDPASQQDDEAFVDWFNGVATPWAPDLKPVIEPRAER